MTPPSLCEDGREDGVGISTAEDDAPTVAVGPTGYGMEEFQPDEAPALGEAQPDL